MMLHFTLFTLCRVKSKDKTNLFVGRTPSIPLTEVPIRQMLYPILKYVQSAWICSACWFDFQPSHDQLPDLGPLANRVFKTFKLKYCSDCIKKVPWILASGLGRL